MIYLELRLWKRRLSTGWKKCVAFTKWYLEMEWSLGISMVHWCMPICMVQKIWTGGTMRQLCPWPRNSFKCTMFTSLIKCGGMKGGVTTITWLAYHSAYPVVQKVWYLEADNTLHILRDSKGTQSGVRFIKHFSREFLGQEPTKLGMFGQYTTYEKASTFGSLWVSSLLQ